ncbi:MAG: hypothetical protein WD825_15485 [Gemmatimonadaceae bacterium]
MTVPSEMTRPMPVEETVFGLEVDRKPSVIGLLRLASHLLAGSTLAAYAGWTAAKLLTHVPEFLALERAAFGAILSAIAPATAAAVPALTVAAAVGYILVSIASAIVVHYVLPVWHKKIKRQQRWLRVQRWGVSPWGDVALFFAWVCQWVEVIFFTLVWVTTAVVIFINLMVLLNP